MDLDVSDICFRISFAPHTSVRTGFSELAVATNCSTNGTSLFQLSVIKYISIISLIFSQLFLHSKWIIPRCWNNVLVLTQPNAEKVVVVGTVP